MKPEVDAYMGRGQSIFPNPTNVFTHCIVGLPVARIDIMEAKVAACLHPSALQLASGSNEGARHRGSQLPIATPWH